MVRAPQTKGPRLSPPFIVDEPNYPRSLSEASSHSVAANPWEIRDGEDVLVRAPIQNYLLYDTKSRESHSRKGDLKIFELRGRFDIPTRRVAIRSCGPEERYESFCRSLWILNTLQTKFY